MTDSRTAFGIVTLYLVRHGDTAGGASRGYKGSLDVPLSETGREEMKITADFIRRHIMLSSSQRRSSYLREIHSLPSVSGLVTDGRDRPAASVYCSDLSRARDSAAVIASLFNTQPEVVTDLRERHFGLWEGMSFGEIKRDYRDEFTKWASDPLRFSPPEGETTLAVHERTVPALSRILEEAAHDGQAEDRNVIIVAHGGVNRVILCHLLGIPLVNVFTIEQDSGAVNIIEFWGGRPIVKSLNLSPGIIRMGYTEKTR